MSSSPLKSVVEHDARLDMLDSLDRNPQTIRHLSEQTGRDERHVAHHMKMLVDFDLASETGDQGEDKQPLYVTDLKEQPAWVARAVNVRRRARANKR